MNAPDPDDDVDELALEGDDVDAVPEEVPWEEEVRRSEENAAILFLMATCFF